MLTNSVREFIVQIESKINESRSCIEKSVASVGIYFVETIIDFFAPDGDVSEWDMVLSVPDHISYINILFFSLREVQKPIPVPKSDLSPVFRDTNTKNQILDPVFGFLDIQNRRRTMMQIFSWHAKPDNSVHFLTEKLARFLHRAPKNMHKIFLALKLIFQLVFENEIIHHIVSRITAPFGVPLEKIAFVWFLRMTFPAEMFLLRR